MASSGDEKLNRNGYPSAWSKHKNLIEHHDFPALCPDRERSSWVSYIDHKLEIALSAAYPDVNATIPKNEMYRRKEKAVRDLYDDPLLRPHWKPQSIQWTLSYLGEKFNNLKSRSKKPGKKRPNGDDDSDSDRPRSAKRPATTEQKGSPIAKPEGSTKPLRPALLPTAWSDHEAAPSIEGMTALSGSMKRVSISPIHSQPPIHCPAPEKITFHAVAIGDNGRRLTKRAVPLALHPGQSLHSRIEASAMYLNSRQLPSIGLFASAASRGAETYALHDDEAVDAFISDLRQQDIDEAWLWIMNIDGRVDEAWDMASALSNGAQHLDRPETTLAAHRPHSSHTDTEDVTMNDVPDPTRPNATYPDVPVFPSGFSDRETRKETQLENPKPTIADPRPASDANEPLPVDDKPYGTRKGPRSDDGADSTDHPPPSEPPGGDPPHVPAPGVNPGAAEELEHPDGDAEHPIVVDSDEDPPDDTVDKREENTRKWRDARHQQSTDTLPKCTQLSDENIAAYLEWHDFDDSAWSPDAEFLLPGMRVCVKEYQLYTAWWVLCHAGRFALDTESSPQRTGPTIGHDMGLGKTACVIAIVVLNFHLLALQREIEADRAHPPAPRPPKHLPLGAPTDQRCPSRKSGDWPFRCPCEERDPELIRGTAPGAVVITAPVPVMWKWNHEFNGFVDFETFERICGHPMRIAMGHGEVSKASCARRVADVVHAPLRLPDLTLNDWLAANSATDPRSIDRVVMALERGDFDLLAQPTVDADASGLVILTTVHSFATQVQKPTSATWTPELSRPIACNRGDTCTAPSESARSKCSVKFHTHTAKARSREAVPVAWFFLDEAHEVFGHYLIREGIRTYNQAQFQTFGRCAATCAVTGTPMANMPSEAMIVFASTQECDRIAPWSEQGALKPYTRKRLKTLEQMDKTMRAIRISGKVTKNQEAQFPAAKGLTGESATEAAFDTYDEALIRPIGEFIAQHMIKFKGDDEYRGKKLQALPALYLTDHVVLMDAPWADKIEPLLTRYSKNSQLLSEITQAAEQGRPLQDGGPTRQVLENEVRHSGRKLIMCINFPALVEMMTQNLDRAHPMLAKTIHGNKWWDHPENSPFHPIRHELFASSPKIQKLVREAKMAPKVKTTVQCFSHDGTPTSVTVEHREKIVIACFEPALALCVMIVLRAQLADTYEAESIATMHAESNRVDLIERFQLKPCAVAAKRPNIDILVLCTRTGSVGIELTASHRMFLLDIDPKASRKEQVPKRCHRLGQKEDVTCVQLLEEKWGLDSNARKARDQGSNILTQLLGVKNADDKDEK